MVRTWIADVRPLLAKNRYKEYYEAAPDERKAKVDGVLKSEDKILSLGVWGLYNNVREKYGISSDAVYNFSHSGSYVLCSIEMDEGRQVRLGCDIEEIGGARLHVAKRFFCPDEYLYIKEQSGEAVRQEFYRYWVLKESFMKAVRLGMKLPMNAFEIQITDSGIPILINVPKELYDQYIYMEYGEHNGLGNIPYKAAVCSNDPDIAKEIETEKL